MREDQGEGEVPLPGREGKLIRALAIEYR